MVRFRTFVVVVALALGVLVPAAMDAQISGRSSGQSDDERFIGQVYSDNSLFLMAVGSNPDTIPDDPRHFTPADLDRLRRIILKGECYRAKLKTYKFALGAWPSIKDARWPDMDGAGDRLAGLKELYSKAVEAQPECRVRPSVCVDRGRDFRTEIKAAEQIGKDTANMFLDTFVDPPRPPVVASVIGGPRITLVAYPAGGRQTPVRAAPSLIRDDSGSIRGGGMTPKGPRSLGNARLPSTCEGFGSFRFSNPWSR